MRSKWCAVAVLLAACSDSATEPAQSDLDFASTALGWSRFAGNPPDGRVEHNCTGGGKRIWIGSRTTTIVDNDQTQAWRGEDVHLNCVEFSNGRQVVTNGSSHSEGYYKFRMTYPPTVLAVQVRGSGTMTITSYGKSQTCRQELNMDFDPSTNLLRLWGTICGRAFDNARPYN